MKSKIDDNITHLTILESKLVASPDLQQTYHSLLLSLPDKVQQFSNRLTSCELNHENVIQKLYIYKKDVHDFLGMGTPSYMNSSNLPSPSHDHDVPMSFHMVLEKTGNPLDPITNHHFQTFLTHYNKWQHFRDRGGYLSLYGYVQTSPAVYDLYLRKVKRSNLKILLSNLPSPTILFFLCTSGPCFFPSWFRYCCFWHAN